MTPPDIDGILMRSALALVIGAAIILGYEWLYHKKYEGRQVPLLPSFTAIFGYMIFAGGAIVTGAGLSLRFVDAPDRPIVVGAGLIALWLGNIALQIGQNLVRSALGKPELPLAFINHNAFRRKSTRRSKDKLEG